jgi:CDP-diacylglycerol--glycerol-3-phosphate 3-phosphatidyltransferase
LIDCGSISLPRISLRRIHPNAAARDQRRNLSIMSVTTKNDARPAVWNLPNQLTVLRLVLSVVLFVLIAYEYYLASLVMFIVAASTDWIDGYLARKYQMVTTLGRILDPFADKIIICGTFIFLLGVPEELGLSAWLRPWMVVVVVGREMLVTVLRSFFEQQGIDFSASMSGKLKMVFQCIAAGVSLYFLYDAAGRTAAAAEATSPSWLVALLAASIWAAVLLTVFSGAVYVRKAFDLRAR